MSRPLMMAATAIPLPDALNQLKLNTAASPFARRCYAGRVIHDASLDDLCQKVWAGGRIDAAEALRLMEERKITSIVVTTPAGTVDGVVHLHDLWRTQLI